ncbi:alpha/beta hydrolase [Burkholderia pseudomallei]|uniref:alpha/beta hydrolase n=1 Tax=Burkholderia pseudomallei TaxID=28450 RepID=UPI000A1CD21A|nr:alpha/beta fold hydrolase [Burkholderia pseudomallei]
MYVTRHLLVILSLYLLISNPSYSSSIEKCIGDFMSYRNSNIAAGVAEKHMPQLLLAEPVPSDRTVVLIHGLYESPYFLKGIARRFAASGYNVVSLRLTGHWARGWQDLDTVSYRDWVADTETGLSIATCLGPKVVVAGHSLGGTLALHAALADPRRVSALVLLAPAIELELLPTLGGLLGTLTGLDGNLFTGMPANGDESARISGRPVIQLYELLQHIGQRFGDSLPLESPLVKRDMRLSYLHVGSRVQVPTFGVVPERDPAINWRETVRLLRQISGPTRHIIYPPESAVWHANVAKSKIDAYRTAPGDYNPSFDALMDQIVPFVNDSVSARGTSSWPTR